DQVRRAELEVDAAGEDVVVVEARLLDVGVAADPARGDPDVAGDVEAAVARLHVEVRQRAGGEEERDRGEQEASARGGSLPEVARPVFRPGAAFPIPLPAGLPFRAPRLTPPHARSR